MSKKIITKKKTNRKLTARKTLDLGKKAYILSKKTINLVVKDKIGNYALGFCRKNKGGIKKMFTPKYVGRSDMNLKDEVIQQGLVLKVKKDETPKYTHFKFSHKRKTPKTAYEHECKNFHDYGGTQKLDNERHPKRPDGFKKNMLPCSKMICKD